MSAAPSFVTPLPEKTPATVPPATARGGFPGDFAGAATLAVSVVVSALLEADAATALVLSDTCCGTAVTALDPLSALLITKIGASRPPFLSTTNVPPATTRSVAATRHTIGSTRFFGAATGITPRGALSSAVRIRDDAAMNPRASATAAAHSGQSFTCDSTSAASSALNAPSSHE
jgi:hypothetical protein